MSLFIIAIEGARPPAVSQMLKTLFAAECANENDALAGIVAGRSTDRRRQTGNARALQVTALLERLNASDPESRPWWPRSAPFPPLGPRSRGRAAQQFTRRRATTPLFGLADGGHAELRSSLFERRCNVSTSPALPDHAGLRLDASEI
jgi:hypothetical protein